MAQAVGANDRTLADYGSLARRRWKAIALAIILGLVLGVLYLRFATPTYVSTAKVLVQSVSTDSASTGARTIETVNLDTEAQLVKSFTVASLAAKSLAFVGDPARLTAHVNVTVPANTTVLDIAYSSSTPEGARKGAQAFASAYLKNRTDTAQRAINAEISLAQGVLNQLATQLRGISNQLNNATNPPTSIEKTGLIARRDNINAQIGAASVQLTSLQGTPVTGGNVIFAAQTPNKKSTPNPYLILPSALMGGLLLAVGFVWLRERMDKRIYAAADVERLLGVPVVAQADASRAPTLERSAAVQHEMLQVYRMVRAPELSAPVMILFVGSGDFAADELAGVFAGASARCQSATTLLRRDCNLDDPASILTSASPHELTVADYESLGITAEGQVQTQEATRILGQVAESRDVVVLGLPTGNRAVDLAAIGHVIDVAVLVIELGTTRRGTISQLLGDLSRTNVRQVVAVAMRLPKASRRKQHRAAAQTVTSARD